MSSRISVSSTEYVRITADPIRDGAPVDPTADVVELGFPAAGVAPVDEDWHTAEWETTKPPYVARVLVGDDGDFSLAEGSYDVYLRVTDGDEKPAVLADRVVIYSSPGLLASVLDLADRVPELNLSAEDPAATRALEEATDFIRAETGLVFSLVEEDVQYLRGTWDDHLWLPQKPVLELLGLAIRVPGDAAFQEFDVSGLVAERRGLVHGVGGTGLLLDGYWGGGWGGPHSTIKATYSHGFAQIPPEIVRVCCSLAGRIIGEDSPEVETKTIVNFSVTYRPSAGAEVGLTKREDTVLRRWAAWAAAS